VPKPDKEELMRLREEGVTEDEDQEIQDEEEEVLEDDLYEPLEYDLDYDLIPVLLRRRETKEEWKCELREFPAHVRDEFLREHGDRINQRTQEVKNYKDIQVILLSKILWDLETEKLVPKEEIRLFPSKVQHGLYMKGIKLCGLDDKAALRAKKI
jgi:hypothetical protein